MNRSGDPRVQRGRAARVLVLSPVQAGVALGFVVLGLLAAFGGGVMVGIWYQGSDTVAPYGRTTSAAIEAGSQGPADKGESQSPTLTFYSILTGDAGTQGAFPKPPASPARPLAAVPPLTPGAAAPPPSAPRAEDQKPSAAGREQPVARVPEPLPPPKPGNYSVQVGSFRARDQAEHLRRRLVAKGYPARVELMRAPESGLWYRVRVGSFAERAAAQQMGTRLTTQEKVPAFVTSDTQ